jgi:hypothetical protein
MEEALRRGPESADLYLAAAELERSQAEASLPIEKKAAQKLAGQGLAYVAKAAAINPTLPSAVALEGQLHLIAAKAASSPKERAASAQKAKSSLEKALGANPFLKEEHGAALAQATALAAP